MTSTVRLCTADARSIYLFPIAKYFISQTSGNASESINRPGAMIAANGFNLFEILVNFMFHMQKVTFKLGLLCWWFPSSQCSVWGPVAATIGPENFHGYQDVMSTVFRLW